MSKAEDGTHPDIPEKSWSNPFREGTPLAELFGDIVREERDIIFIVDDYHARRGTGKTVASLQLANGLDQTDDGLTEDKVSLQPEEVREAYVSQPNRSGIVLDEAEVGASNRQAMSKVNQALREIMSMGRVEEKYVVVNTPAKSMIDKDIRMLSDVWISMVRRGQGLVHFLEREPYSSQQLTPKKQLIDFKDIPKGTELRNIYNQLTREKQQRMRGSEGAGYVPREEHKDELERARDEAAKEMRDDIIEALWASDTIEASQKDIGKLDPVDINQSTVSKIIRNRGQ